MHAFLTLALATAASASHISIPFSRGAHPYGAALDLHKRTTGAFDLDALNNVTGGGYYSELGIGTPPQKLGFMLDTGSSDTWVNSVDVDLCSDSYQQQTVGYCMKTFDYKDSSTFKRLDTGSFDIQYLDGRAISGDYFNDTVTFNNRTLRQQRLGLATNSVRPTGIMGLGFSTGVSAAEEYPAIIDQMKAQGLISSAAFSLYLNDLESSSGTILFGGVDTKKFIGSLAKLPIVRIEQSTSDKLVYFAVDLSGITATGKKAPSIPNFSGQAILDSGSTISLLPDDIAGPISDALGAVSVSGVQVPFVDCAQMHKLGDFKINYQFGSKTISVPGREFIIDAFGAAGTQLLDEPVVKQYFKGWSKVCLFGLAGMSDYNIDFALLGDTFLRSAYVVYDMDSKRIGIAQANLNASESSIQEIKASSGIPDVNGVSTGNDGSVDDQDSGVAKIVPSLAVLAALAGAMALL